MITEQECLERDARDPLRRLRALFQLPEGQVYLDGNSLGPLPAAMPARLREVVEQEWGQALIRSWNDAGWIDLPQRVGGKIAQLIGAAADEVVACDSTSVNLYKVLSAALSVARGRGRDRIVSERSNFPTDLYVAAALAERHGMQLVLADAEDIPALLDARAAVLMLTHVDYRSGRMHDMAAMTRLAHDAGALAVWDLAHSAGAVPVDLNGAGADFAVGCGYKYLNGGPGAPSFVWVHRRHHDLRQPLAGWMGHAAPFDFQTDYAPAPGIARYLCGTPSILALSALECGVDTVLAAEPLGGVAALRRKSLALTDLFIELVEQYCAGHGLERVTPLAPEDRGSQVCYTRGEGGYAIVQALVEHGVIGDFREPDILRFGFAPLYTRHVDVWRAVQALREVLESGQWREPRFSRRAAVT